MAVFARDPEPTLGLGNVRKAESSLIKSRVRHPDAPAVEGLPSPCCKSGPATYCRLFNLVPTRARSQTPDARRRCDDIAIRPARHDGRVTISDAAKRGPSPIAPDETVSNRVRFLHPKTREAQSGQTDGDEGKSGRLRDGRGRDHADPVARLSHIHTNAKGCWVEKSVAIPT